MQFCFSAQSRATVQIWGFGRLSALMKMNSQQSLPLFSLLTSISMPTSNSMSINTFSSFSCHSFQSPLANSQEEDDRTILEVLSRKKTTGGISLRAPFLGEGNVFPPNWLKNLFFELEYGPLFQPIHCHRFSWK